MKAWIVVLVAALVVMAAGPATAGPLILNGGFEDCPTVGLAPWGQNNVGNAPAACYSSYSTQAETFWNSGVWIPSPTINPNDGNYMVEWGDDSDQGISQTFTAGGVLTVTFAYNLLAFDWRYYGGDEGPDWFYALIDGSPIFGDSINAPGDTWVQSGWKTVSVNTADLPYGPHTLQFCTDSYPNDTGLFSCSPVNLSAENPTLKAFVDSVDIVPEPASVLLLGIGLASVAGGARRRLRK